MGASITARSKSASRFDSAERQLEPVWGHETHARCNDVVSRRVFEREGENEVQTLAFAPGVKFREIHRNPNLCLESAICASEVELVNLSFFTDPNHGMDLAGYPGPGGK
jgi:hypothetical protein